VEILTVNAGSTSLKLGLVAPDGALLAQADLAADDFGGLERFLAEAPAPDAAAHRFVHGGSIDQAALLDAGVLEEIEAAAELAPLHTPLALEGVRQLTRRRPELRQVACFDTAFHRTLPEAAAVYAIPADWRRRHGVRRRGFHGLSHAWASRRAAELIGRKPEDLRVVTCHVGAGVSLAAVAGGRSVDTTMGMTPAEGPMMATRSGTIDPGAVLLLVEREDGARAVRDGLERHSGLLGLSGVSGDMREVLAAADGGDEQARVAIDVYVHRLRAAVGAMAASMGGVDALAFTGGVGENSARIRASVCEALGFLGVELDTAANESRAGDGAIGAAGSRTRVLVVRAREDLEMAREAESVLRR
jgi:acetate kinase